MGKDLRGRINFNRKRLYIRNYINKKNIAITVSVVIIAIASIVTVSNVILINKVNANTKRYIASIDNSNKDYTIPNSSIEGIDLYEEENEEKNQNVLKTPEEPNIEDMSKIKFTLLGELMMGGDISTDLRYVYSGAFKNIYLYTKDADFTYATLGTNITNLLKLEDTKNKYIVTKDIVNAISALGIDSVSVATDHMIDYSENIFDITKNILTKNDILIAGQKDTPVYFEKGNQKVAIVSTNSVLLGTSNMYTNLGISIYDENNLRKNIKEAKKVADVVIADIHWGREFEYGVTPQMQAIARVAIDEGADLVIGSHAVGVYPVIQYKDKPIIYSAGYLFSDSDLYVAKDSFIFDLRVENKKMVSLTMTPIYIQDKKEVKLYSEYDSEKCNEILKMYNTWHIENGLNSSIIDNKIEIKF